MHRWFSDASRSLKSPNLPACSIIATKIADARDRPGEPPWSIDTYRSARSLLKHLRIDRDLAKARGATDHEMQRWALVIDRVEGAVDPILNHVKPNDVQDLAQQIASIARYAWQDSCGDSREAWPGAVPSMKRIAYMTQSRTICSVTPPILAASVRVAPS